MISLDWHLIYCVSFEIAACIKRPIHKSVVAWNLFTTLTKKNIVFIYISKNARKFLFYFFTYYYITHIATWKHSLIEKIYNLILLLTNHILSMAQYSKHEKNHCNNKSVCTINIILLGLFIKHKPFTSRQQTLLGRAVLQKNKKKQLMIVIFGG